MGKKGSRQRWERQRVDEGMRRRLQQGQRGGLWPMEKLTVRAEDLRPGDRLRNGEVLSTEREAGEAGTLSVRLRLYDGRVARRVMHVRQPLPIERERPLETAKES